MTESMLRRILQGLVVLVILWLGSAWLTGRSGGETAGDGGLAAIFEGLSEATVSAVRIAGPNETMTIAQSAGVWTVNGHATDSTTLSRFWSALEEAEVGGIAANNSANHPRMGVSADSAYSVDFTRSDGGSAILLVGKGGPIFPSGYVRLPDQDAVIVVSGDFQPVVRLSATDWRDKTILRLDTAAVARIVLETDEGTLVVERGDSTWTADGGPANPAFMNPVLQELANLIASGFVEEGEVFEESPKRVIALGAAGDTLGVVMVAGESGTRHVRTPGNDVVFEVPSFRADRVAPDIVTVRAEPSGTL
jgi:hypothetical protein